MLDDNTHLAKWLNNELTPEEMEEFKKQPEYAEYEKLIKGMSYFKAPAFDVEKSLAATLEKTKTNKKSKVIKLSTVFYVAAIAASVLLLVGFFFNTVNVIAPHGQQLAVALPDGSEVKLNAGSNLSYKRFSWFLDRRVALEGEAYFKVSQGNAFTVGTSLGTVEVLGTEFNVKERNEIFEVNCYEGKVSVTSGQAKEILSLNEGVTLKSEKLIKSKKERKQPDWLQGESRFESIPLAEVLNEMERQFDVTFVRDGVDESSQFTGGFVHKDLELALQGVLLPMEIEYQIDGKKITLKP